MANELKPCPFCGGNRPLLNESLTNFYEEVYYVICEDCQCRGKSCRCKEKAIEAWNRRADNGENETI